ncbi:MAG: segregation ATPase FtsK/SpoIIIE, family, partial [Mycobacterium sp.]|nr:segregation ATPase FtsK/SpoIIIE, family [Mycobacterium sp.]
MVAKGAGTTARSVGRARDLEPGHRRDGIALGLLGIAVVLAASSWFDAARPVGGWIDTVVRVVIGAAVVLVPILLIAIAVVLMRTEPNPEARPRLILGAAMIGLPALGLWHLWAGAPDDPVARRHAAGFVGFALGGPLSDGLTPWIATPLLIIGVLFGVLLMTGTTIREVPSTLRALFGTGYRGDDYGNDDYYDDDERANGQPDDFSDGYYDEGDLGDEAQAWPVSGQPAGAGTGTPYDNYPLEDEAPTVPEPTARVSRRKKPAKKTDTLVLDRIVDGPYQLPSLDLLVAGD